MRSSSTLAGSSFGSCGTSFPSNARFRIACRIRSARFRFAATAASAFSTTDSRRSTSATIRSCSASGGNGTGMVREVRP